MMQQSLSSPCATSARNRAGSARVAAALALRFFRAATGPATFDQRFSKLAELNLSFVCLGQSPGVRFELWRHIAQEVEEQALAIEKMFNVDEHGRYSVLPEHRCTCRVCVLAIFFESRLKQFILHRYATQQLAVGEVPRIVVILRRRKDVTHFEAAARADDHAATARITHRIDGGESTDLAHSADTNKVITRHT